MVSVADIEFRMKKYLSMYTNGNLTNAKEKYIPNLAQK